MSLYVRVPKMIKQALAKNNWQQSQLAELVCCSPQHISDLLNGRRHLSQEMAVRLGLLIGIPARKLLIAQLDEELERAPHD